MPCTDAADACACYACYGADKADGCVWSRACYAMSGADIGRDLRWRKLSRTSRQVMAGLNLRACCARSGTDICTACDARY
eukprot:1949008-Rhodomonas_salina.2